MEFPLSSIILVKYTQNELIEIRKNTTACLYDLDLLLLNKAIIIKLFKAIKMNNIVLIKHFLKQELEYWDNIFNMYKTDGRFNDITIKIKNNRKTLYNKCVLKADKYNNQVAVKFFKSLGGSLEYDDLAEGLEKKYIRKTWFMRSLKDQKLFQSIPMITTYVKDNNMQKLCALLKDLKDVENANMKQYLFVAARYNNDDAIRIILSIGANDYNMILKGAARGGHKDLFEKYLEIINKKKIIVDWKQCLCSAAHGGNFIW
jgi:hypothetical protein